MRRHAVVPGAESRFRAFLDGTQRSVVGMYDGIVPLVFGVVSAVIRERVDRRMRTWNAPEQEMSIYASKAQLTAVRWDTLQAAADPIALRDTTEQGEPGIAHPLTLRDAAYRLVQARREAAEHRLAVRWCQSERNPLFIDGSITGGEAVSSSEWAIGVVKSHLTLYAEGRDIDLIMTLGENERTSVFRVVPRNRRPVASWYLRMRDPAGRDPMWGLVRVEVADSPSATPAHLAARADEVSSWILAESSPLALPDGRWDTMVYGVRDCEEYLRAVHFQT